MRIQISHTDSVLTLEHSGESPVAFNELIHKLEKKTIETLLVEHGTKAKVAEQMKLNRTTLVEKCRRHGLPLKT